jgi:hypothetical protein
MQPPEKERLAEVADDLIRTYRDLASTPDKIMLRLQVSGRSTDAWVRLNKPDASTSGDPQARVSRKVSKSEGDRLA